MPTFATSGHNTQATCFKVVTNFRLQKQLNYLKVSCSARCYRKNGKEKNTEFMCVQVSLLLPWAYPVNIVIKYLKPHFPSSVCRSIIFFGQARTIEPSASRTALFTFFTLINPVKHSSYYIKCQFLTPKQ